MPRPASPDDFASELKRGRIAAGLSQAELGARAGLTGSYVCMLELRRKPAPAPDVVEKLAAALGLDAARLQERAALERTPEPVRQRIVRLAKDRLRTRRNRDRLLSTTIFHIAKRPGFMSEDVATAMGLPADYRSLFGRLAERVRRAPTESDAERESRDVLRDVPAREREALVQALPRLLGAAAAAMPQRAPDAAPPAPPTEADEPEERRPWRRVPVLASVPPPGVAATDVEAIDVFHVDRRLWRVGAFVLVADDDDAWPRVERGDWLLVDARAVPADGDLVVVRHDGRARVRVLKRLAGEVRLDAPRADAPPLRLPESRLSLAGIVRWVFRPLEAPPPPRRRSRDDADDAPAGA
ncbi:MAG: helix-turn-helix domain-containing protein [Planctomycetota bacterium]